MFRAQDPFADRQQGSELVAGPVRVPRPPGPVADFMAGAQSVRMFRAQDSFVDRQQGGGLVAGPGRVPRSPGPVGQAAADG